MITSVNISKSRNELTLGTQKVARKLEPIIGVVNILELIKDKTKGNNDVFEEKLNHPNSQLVVSEFTQETYLNKIKEATTESDVLLLVDSVDLSDSQKIIQQLTDNQKIIVEGSVNSIKKALSGDKKSNAVCLQKKELSQLLSLSKETIADMLTSEILSDPMFEDVPFVFIYDEIGNGYVLNNEEMYTVSVQNIEGVAINHEGMLLGLAYGMEAEKIISEMVKIAIICGIASNHNQDTLFDQHYFEDKISVTKIA